MSHAILHSRKKEWTNRVMTFMLTNELGSSVNASPAAKASRAMLNEQLS